jgi:hypothetical protein
VVHLVALLEPAQDADGVLHRRLADQHLLEAALQRGVLLDVLAVLVQRGRADHAQLTAGEHRLDHVASVHRALTGRAGADDRVQLVDEGDDLPGGVRDLLEDGLEPFLELAAVLRAGHHRAEVERDDALAAQRLGHVARHDPLGEALDDRGLADARLADQHRVVLGAPREHLHHAADLGVAADHRVQLALAGALGEVDAVLLQRLVAALRIRAGHRGEPRTFANASRSASGWRRGGGAAAATCAALVREPDEQVLGRDVLVAHLRGQLLRGGDRGERLTGELGGGDRRARRRGQPVAQRRHLGADRRRIRTDGREQRRGDAVALAREARRAGAWGRLGVAGQRGGLHRAPRSPAGSSWWG